MKSIFKNLQGVGAHYNAAYVSYFLYMASDQYYNSDDNSKLCVQGWKKLWDHMWNWKLLTLLKKDLLNNIYNTKT